jgi:hypothetical protein
MAKPNTNVTKNLELAATSSTEASPKKPYTSPCLKVYGTIEAITQTIGLHGQRDAGHGWKHRTH